MRAISVTILCLLTGTLVLAALPPGTAQGGCFAFPLTAPDTAATADACASLDAPGSIPQPAGTETSSAAATTGAADAACAATVDACSALAPAAESLCGPSQGGCSYEGSFPGFRYRCWLTFDGHFAKLNCIDTWTMQVFL